MAVNVQVKAPDLGKVRREIEEMRARLRDLSPVTKVAAEQVKSLIDASFAASRSAVDGSPWAPLAPRTVEQKTRQGYSLQPLVRRGARGLQGQTFAEATKAGFRFGVGPLAPYGVYHQDGTRRIPSRPFLPVDSAHQPAGPRLQAILRELGQRIVRYVTTGKV